MHNPPSVSLGMVGFFMHNPPTVLGSTNWFCSRALFFFWWKKWVGDLLLEKKKKPASCKKMVIEKNILPNPTVYRTNKCKFRTHKANGASRKFLVEKKEQSIFNKQTKGKHNFQMKFFFFFFNFWIFDFFFSLVFFFLKYSFFFIANVCKFPRNLLYFIISIYNPDPLFANLNPAAKASIFGRVLLGAAVSSTMENSCALVKSLSLRHPSDR